MDLADKLNGSKPLDSPILQMLQGGLAYNLRVVEHAQGARGSFDYTDSFELKKSMGCIFWGYFV